MNLSKKALIGNICLLIMELIGIIIILAVEKSIDMKFYTNWSNILGFVTSILFIINYCIKEKNKKFNEVVKYFKLTTTVCLTVTFIIVLLIFVPMDHFNFVRWMIEKQFVSFHFLSPIIAFVTFIFFERYEYTYIKSGIIGMIFSTIYSIVISILVLCKKVPAPYPFLDYYAHTPIVNILSVSAVFIIIIIFTLVFILIKRKQQKENI